MVGWGGGSGCCAAAGSDRDLAGRRGQVKFGSAREGRCCSGIERGGGAGAWTLERNGSAAGGEGSGGLVPCSSPVSRSPQQASL